MAPFEHALGKLGRQHAFVAQNIQYLVAQGLTERCLRQRRQHPKRAGGQEHAVSDQGMDMWTESHEVAEGLHVEYKG